MKLLFGRNYLLCVWKLCGIEMQWKQLVLQQFLIVIMFRHIVQHDV